MIHEPTESQNVGPSSGGMAEEPSTYPVGKDEKDSPVSTGWYAKIFNHGFTPEDVILYFIALLLISMFWLSLWRTQSIEAEIVQNISNQVAEQVVNQWKITNQPSGTLLTTLDLNDTFMRAQVIRTAMQYQHGSIITTALSARKNLAFLIGAIVLIFGCIIAIRGVRESVIDTTISVQDRASLALRTSSPGVFMVFIGGILLALTVWTADSRLRITEGELVCGLCGVIPFTQSVSPPDHMLVPPVFSDN